MMLPLDRWDWPSFAAFVTVMGTFFGFLIWFGRMVLSRNFASHADHIAMGGRITLLEKRVEATATREDLARLEMRMAPVETGVAVLRAETQAVKETSLRTEHMVSMLVEHQLRGDREA